MRADLRLKKQKRLRIPGGKGAATAALAVGCVMLAVFLLAACAPSAFAPYSPTQTFDPWLPSSSEHVFGTDDTGADVFTSLVYATGRTLLTGVASAALALALGVLAGLAAGYGGVVGAVANAVIDIFAMIPKLPATIVVAAFTGGGIAQTVTVIAVFGWVTTARAVRAKVAHLNGRPFVDALTAAGYPKAGIAFKHILPNTLEVILTRFVTTVAGCIMTEATLSFLGLGDISSPTWGTMINLAYRRGGFAMDAYGWLLAPGAAIMLLALAFWCVWYFAEHRSRDVSGRSYAD